MVFLTVPCVGQQCVIVVFPDHTHLVFIGIAKDDRIFSIRITVQNMEMSIIT